MRVFLFVFFLLTMSKADVEGCTDSVKDLIDSLANVAISMEENTFLPDHDSLKSVLVSIEEIIEKCANKKSRLPDYYGCFDRVYVVLPLIQQLAFSIISREWGKVTEDVINIILQTVNGVTYCINVE